MQCAHVSAPAGAVCFTCNQSQHQLNLAARPPGAAASGFGCGCCCWPALAQELRVLVDRLTVLGLGTFPVAKPGSVEQLSTGREDSQFVEVRGVVRSARLEEERIYFVIEVATGERVGGACLNAKESEHQRRNCRPIKKQIPAQNQKSRPPCEIAVSWVTGNRPS
jgi:hypothetical protein